VAATVTAAATDSTTAGMTPTFVMWGVYNEKASVARVVWHLAATLVCKAQACVADCSGPLRAGECRKHHNVVAVVPTHRVEAPPQVINRSAASLVFA